MRKKRRNASALFLPAAFLFAAGIYMMLFPVLSDLISQLRQTAVITQFRSAEDALRNGEKGREMARASAYNAELFKKQKEEPFVYTPYVKEPLYESLLDDGGIMGYISIPSISVRLPIGHGTSTATLAYEAGHLMGTSLPVGGTSTHAVLAAHSALPTAVLFTHIDRLKIGSIFYIHVFDEVHAYAVDQIKTVLPSDMEYLQIEEGRDLITLLTCTPYGINTHRLLVRGSRINDPPESEDTVYGEKTDSAAVIVKITAVLSLPLLLLVAAGRIAGCGKKHNERKIKK